MRILHVNKFLYRRGGAEAYALDLAELQRGAGDEVEFFAMEHPENLSGRYSAWFPSYMELNPPPSSLGGRARVAGRMVWSLESARAMERVVADFEPDIAHLHNIYHQLSPSILRPLDRAGVPIVMTLHDYKLACPSYHLHDGEGPCDACVGSTFHHAVLRRCSEGSLAGSALLALESSIHRLTRRYGPVDVFHCPSAFMADRMEAAGVFPERLRRQPLFIDPSDLPARRSGLLEGPGVYLGRLSREKAVDVLISAAAHLPEGHQVEIIGDGPEREALERQATAEAPGRVVFHGHRSRAEAHQMLGRAAYMVVPSRWYENHPLTIVEAKASGIPVIGADHGGIRELIAHERDGLLVPVEDVAALGEAMTRLATDPELAGRLGEAGGQRYDEAFTPETHRVAMNVVYEEARRHRRGR